MRFHFVRHLSALLLPLILTCTLCACQQSGTSEAAASSDSSSLPELKIGVDILNPFFYKDENGDYAGIDAEIAREACGRAGLRPVFVTISWNSKDDYLADGSVDCLWNAFSEDGRESQYLWTVPYMESELAVLVDSQCPDHSLKELHSRGGIAVRAGSKAEEVLLKDTANTLTRTEKIYSCGSFDQAKTAFIKGYTGALACHKAVLQQIMSEYPGVYRLLEGSTMTVHLGVAFPRDADSAACQSLDKAFTEMKQDGTISSIIARYTPDDSDAQEGGTADVSR